MERRVLGDCGTRVLRTRGEGSKLNNTGLSDELNWIQSGAVMQIPIPYV